MTALRIFLLSFTLLPVHQLWAAECAELDTTFNLKIPCLQSGNDKISVDLSFQASGGWEINDLASATTNEQCDLLNTDLSFELSCVRYSGLYFQTLFTPQASAQSNFGLYWQLESFQQIDDPNQVISPWVTYSHPCQENQTDAFWWDDDQTAWVGCGTGLSGRGLWNSNDGGQSWAQIRGFMETWRVNGIRRAPDGRLYVTGTDTTSSNIVVSFDTTVSPFEARLEFARGNTIDLSFTAEHILVDSAGNAFTDSLTGSGSAYRNAGSDEWVGLHTGWTSDGSSHQILDMALFNDRFYAVGSTIAQPPQVFLPTLNSDNFYTMTPVNVGTSNPLQSVVGELWGLTVLDSTRVVAAGVDQNRNVGIVFTSHTDPYDAANYQMFDVSTIISDSFSWLRGVCSQGETVVAVGEKQPLRSGTGIVLLSTDGGLNFSEITDENISAQTVSRCHILSDGRIAVAGSGGYVGIYTP